ncbi:hypothetical protein Taro_043643, partial [Colocasia esculenta]|nr:hypothetical protein [Colocasia esculenta]
MESQSSLSHLFTLFLLLALLSSGLHCKGLADSGATETTKLYIAYMGEKQHEDPELVTALHHGVLSSALGSKEAALRSIVHSYRHGFSGFAAMLTDSQAKRVAELPGVLGVRLSSTLQLQTTRSWDFLGLGHHLQSRSNSELLRKANGGDGIIIGVIDTGIWPEADSFNDRGYGPIPSRWNGTCQTGEQFNASHCNRKIIGARWYTTGVAEEYLRGEYLSARDQLGHGTHVASIAAGSYVGNASYQGLGRGWARGGAPRARLAVYKVLWGTIANNTGSEAGLLKALDHAAHDGVDVVSLSLVLRERSWGSLDAVLKGITVVYAAGNGGPLPQSVVNAAPWVITVAASTIDRSFPTDITLADNRTLVGQAIYYRTTGVEDGFKELVVATRPRKCSLCSSFGHLDGQCKQGVKGHQEYRPKKVALVSKDLDSQTQVQKENTPQVPTSNAFEILSHISDQGQGDLQQGQEHPQATIESQVVGSGREQGSVSPVLSQEVSKEGEATTAKGKSPISIVQESVQGEDSMAFKGFSSAVPPDQSICENLMQADKSEILGEGAEDSAQKSKPPLAQGRGRFPKRTQRKKVGMEEDSTNVAFPNTIFMICIYLFYCAIVFSPLLKDGKVNSPPVKLSPTRIAVGSKVLAPRVASFSSRGPSPVFSQVLKPDIAAPGVNILAAVRDFYFFLSGTSMATPHVAAIVALLKRLHPGWSPAAIKSAIVTTASVKDEYGIPIVAEGAPRKLADPFDYGGGHINPDRAADPGLIYDIEPREYNQFNCSWDLVILCDQTPQSPVYHLNLPSIAIPMLKGSVTISRTVTNVGPLNSTYEAVVEAPPGVDMQVRPSTLVFDAKTKQHTFSITFSARRRVQGIYTFGSLTWEDATTHSVRIPIAVRPVLREFYADVE